MKTMFAASSILAACAMSDTATTNVTEDNVLGISTLETTHQESGDRRIVDVHGFDADGQERGSVRVSIGPDATEISIVADGRATRVGTRERNHIQLPPLSDRSAQALVEVAAHVLATEANTFVPAIDETNERALTTQICPTDMLLWSPIAQQCCFAN